MAACLLLLAAASACRASRAPDAPSPDAPAYGDPFWAHWGDGRAELAGYDLTYTRYGEPRRGTAITIFVTETFGHAERVKRERPGSSPGDEYPVLKLNLVQDFPTGIYDYNLMTSVFVPVEAANGRAPGTATKVSFSAQEWCGQLYSQALFDRSEVRLALHSYFEGEADRETRLDFPPGAQAEDALLVWARGLAAPALAPGETRELPLLRSLERSRLQHALVEWRPARLRRETQPVRIRVPAGEFEAERLRAEIGEPATDTWEFWVERAAPRRILKWSHSAGVSAELLGSTRAAYWKMSGNEYRSALAELGLAP